MKYRIKYVDNSILKCRVENGLRDKTDKTKKYKPTARETEI